MQNQSKDYYVGALTVGIFGVVISAFILMFIFKGFMSAVQTLLIFILLGSASIAFSAALFLIKKIWDK